MTDRAERSSSMYKVTITIGRKEGGCEDETIVIETESRAHAYNYYEVFRALANVVVCLRELGV